MKLSAKDLPQDPRCRTAALQETLDFLAKEGGGILHLEAGEYEIGSLRLYSGICLELADHAVLRASSDLSLYKRRETEVVNLEQTGIHLLHADHAENVTLCGSGEINGTDTAFWESVKQDEDRVYGIFTYRAVGERPCPLIEFSRCKGIQVKDLTIRQSPGWTLHLYRCRDVRVESIRIRNNLMGPNTDGIVVNGSQEVNVTGCDVCAGDDAINIKATEPDCVAERIRVYDCKAQSSCSGFGTGADANGIIRDVRFEHCTVQNSLRMLQVILWHPGRTEDVVFRDIRGSTFPQAGVFCERPIAIDLQQWVRTDGLLGDIQNITFEDIHCRTRGRIICTAQDGARLENIALKNVQLDIPEIEDPEDVYPSTRSKQTHNYNPQARTARAAVVGENIRTFTLQNVSVAWPRESNLGMKGLYLNRVQDLTLESPGLSDQGSFPGKADGSTVLPRKTGAV